MAIKELKFMGKTIYLHSVKFKTMVMEDVDGNCGVVSKKMVGKGETHYYNADGVEIPKTMVFKKMTMKDGSGKAVSKLKATKDVPVSEKIEYDISEELRGFQEVELMYVVNMTDKTLKSEIIDKGHSYKFTFTNGNGFKIYRAYLTRLKGKIVMYGCLGNAMKKVEDFAFDDEIEIEESIAEQVTEKEMEVMIDY